MIPLKTAVNIFDKEYKKSINFFDRKYQRLREIYFSLFACRALDLIQHEEHFLIFYEQQDRNDVSFIAPDIKGEKGEIRYFDIKEYTPNDPTSFDIFLQHIIGKTSTKDYELIIGVQKDITPGDMQKINWNNLGKDTFLVVANSQENTPWYQARVIFISQCNVYFDDTIDISDLIAPEDPLFIYHDKISFLG